MAWAPVRDWLLALRLPRPKWYRPSNGPHLTATTTRELIAALEALPDHLLLRGEIAQRDAAQRILASDRCLRWRKGVTLTQEQVLHVKAAIDLGKTCMWTGRGRFRRLRSPEELEALCTLTAWAGRQPDVRLCEALVRAVRSPGFEQRRAVVRWTVPGEGQTLTLPPRDCLQALLQRGTSVLEMKTQGFHIEVDNAFREGLRAFFRVRLDMWRLPEASETVQLPSGIDEFRLRGSIIRQRAQPEFAPSRRRLYSAIRDVRFREGGGRWGRTPQPPNYDAPPSNFGSLERRIREQIACMDSDHRCALENKHRPRLDRLRREIHARPELDAQIAAVLRRQDGTCIDANLGAVDAIATEVDAGDALQSMATGAPYCFRKALDFRARRTVAERHRNDDDTDSVEIAHGLSYAIDRRLVKLLGLRSTASKPFFNVEARLPGAVDAGYRNDASAADDLIAAEIDEGFPTLRDFVAGADQLGDSMRRLADEDPTFRAAKATIEATFRRDHEEAVERDPDDPNAGIEAFFKKEAALNQATVDAMLPALRPVLDTLRRHGIGSRPVLPGDAPGAEAMHQTPSGKH